MAEPIRLSYSTVKDLLENCAFKVFLEKIVGLQRDWENPRSTSGTAYHAGIELHERARMAGETLPTAEDMLEAAWKVVRDTDPGWLNARLEGALDEVTVATAGWWSAPIRKGQPGAGMSMRDRVMQWTPLYIEQNLLIELPSGFEWKAIMDAVYADAEGSIVGVDQKSAKHFRRYPHSGKGLGQQGMTYSELLSLALQLRMNYFEYHIARVVESEKANGNWERVRVVSVDPQDDLARAELHENLARAQNVIQLGVFPKAPSIFLCSPEWCAMHKDGGGPCNPDGPAEFAAA